MSQELTRREALKRGAALAGGLVWATPVVQAVGISPALAQPTSPGAENCCIDENGDTVRIASLQMKYLGDDNFCTESEFAQDPALVSCEDFPPSPAELLPDTVYILATASPDIFLGDGETLRPAQRIWFEGEVSVAEGGEFNLAASTASETRLRGETWVHIFNTEPKASDYRQMVGFHTSCSEPLFTGDQFGSVVVEGCTADETPEVSELETESEESTTTEQSTTTTTEASTETTEESTTTTTVEGSTETTGESTTTTTEARGGGPPDGVGPAGNDDGD